MLSFMGHAHSRDLNSARGPKNRDITLTAESQLVQTTNSRQFRRWIKWVQVRSLMTATAEWQVRHGTTSPQPWTRSRGSVYRRECIIQRWKGPREKCCLEGNYGIANWAALRSSSLLLPRGRRPSYPLRAFTLAYRMWVQLNSMLHAYYGPHGRLRISYRRTWHSYFIFQALAGGECIQTFGGFADLV